jgi:hypothetical protein
VVVPAHIVPKHVVPTHTAPVRHKIRPRVKRHRAVIAPVKAPAKPAIKRKRPITASLVSGTVPAAVPNAQSSKTLLRLTLLTFMVLSGCFLGLAAVPLSTIKRPGAIPVALRLRPVFGTVGLSLLGAVAVIYLLGGRLGA